MKKLLQTLVWLCGLLSVTCAQQTANDTAHGIKVIHMRPSAEVEGAFDTPQPEFYFPQYYICELAKKGSIKVFNFENNKTTTELKPDSLFRKVVHYTEPKFTNEGDLYEEERIDTLIREGLLANKYFLVQDLIADNKTKQLFFSINSVVLLEPHPYKGLSDEKFLLAYNPVNDPNVISEDYLTLKNSADTLHSGVLSEVQKVQLEQVIQECVSWGLENQTKVLEKNILLDKKEVKKLLKRLKSEPLLNGVSQVVLKNNWHFNPKNAAFCKVVYEVIMVSASGEAIYKLSR